MFSIIKPESAGGVGLTYPDSIICPQRNGYWGGSFGHEAFEKFEKSLKLYDTAQIGGKMMMMMIGVLRPLLCT